MTETVAEDSDAPVLKQKMEDALATSSSAPASRTRAPFTIFPGTSSSARPAPARRRRSSIQVSSFRSPADNAAMAVQGVGGTRYCDWWFTDEAVLIDTAGRYTTQDSDAKADRRSWLAFLDMLRRESAAPADQRGHRRDQHRRCSQSAGEGGGGACRRDPQAPRRIARGTEGRLPRLRGLHQDGSRRGLHPIFRRSRRSEAAGGLGRDVPDRRQEGQQRRQGSGGDRPPHSAHLGADARAAAGGAGPAIERDPVRLPGAARRDPKADRRLPQSHLRADALPDDRDLARLLFHLRHAGGNAFRRRHRRAAKELRRREPRQRRIFGRRQKLFPARPVDEGDLRRGRVGFDQHRRRAPIVRAAEPRLSR